MRQWKCNFPSVRENNDKPTKQQMEIRAHREFKLPIMIMVVLVGGMGEEWA